MAQEVAAGLIDALGRCEALADNAGALVESAAKVYDDAGLVSFTANHTALGKAGLIDALGRCEALADNAWALVEAAAQVYNDASLVSVPVLLKQCMLALHASDAACHPAGPVTKTAKLSCPTSSCCSCAWYVLSSWHRPLPCLYFAGTDMANACVLCRPQRCCARCAQWTLRTTRPRRSTGTVRGCATWAPSSQTWQTGAISSSLAVRQHPVALGHCKPGCRSCQWLQHQSWHSWAASALVRTLQGRHSPGLVAPLEWGACTMHVLLRRMPGLLASHIALLIPHLGGKTYALRSAIVSAMASLVVHLSADAPPDGRTSEPFLMILPPAVRRHAADCLERGSHEDLTAAATSLCQSPAFEWNALQHQQKAIP